MATGYEVIVKVVADAKKAVSEFEKTSKAAERMAKRTTDETQKAAVSLDAIGKKALIAGGAMTAAGATMAFALRGFVKSAQESEDAQNKLVNTIKGNKNLAPDSIKAFNDQAKAIQNVTVASDEAVNGIQSLLGQFGMTKNQVLTLTPLVVDISRKMGIDFEAAAKAVGKAAEGSTGGLKRMGVIVDETKAKLDPFGATVDALRRAAGGFAQTEGKTFAGQMAILGNHADELKESLGRGVLSVLNAMLPAINGAASAFSGLDDATGGTIGKTLALTAGLLILGGGVLTAVGTVIKLKKAYEEAAAASKMFQAASSGVGIAAAAIVGVAIGQALGGALNEAIFHFSDKAKKGYEQAFTATKGRDVMRGFLSAAEGEAGKSASGLGNIFKGVGAVLVDGVTGGSLHLVENLVKGISKSGFDKAFSKIATADPAAAKSILHYIGTHAELRAALVKTGVNLKEYRKRMGDVADANHDGTVTADEFIGRQNDIAKGADELVNLIGSQGAVTRGWTQAVADVTKAQQGLTDAQKNYNDAVKTGDPQKVADAQATLQGALLQLAAAQDGAREAARKHAEMLIALQATAGDKEKFNAAIESLKAMRDILTDPAEKKAIEEEIDALVKLGIVAGNKIDLNDETIMASLWRLKAAGQITETQLRQLQDLGYVKFDTTSAIAALQGLTGAATLSIAQIGALRVLTGGFGGGVLTQQTQLQIARVVGFTGWDPQRAADFVRANPTAGRASGGPVAANTPYVVGEQGPELFMPTANGSIVPKGLFGNGAGVSSVASNVTINVNAGPLASAADTGAAVLQALKAYERRNGALPLKVA